jgi:hypothetical protein
MPFELPDPLHRVGLEKLENRKIVHRNPTDVRTRGQEAIEKPDLGMPASTTAP